MTSLKRNLDNPKGNETVTVTEASERWNSFQNRRYWCCLFSELANKENRLQSWRENYFFGNDTNCHDAAYILRYKLHNDDLYNFDTDERTPAPSRGQYYGSTAFELRISRYLNILLDQRSWRNSPLGTRPTVVISVFVTLDPEVHEQMSRSGDQSDEKKSTSLVLLYPLTEGMPCGMHVSSFFTIPIAAKCREIDCGVIESWDPILDVDQASTFCRKWSTLLRTGQHILGLWSVSLSRIRNLANSL
ncbi:hypothetical protein TNCV_4149921 [Trichonephila clavipes]|uniref:Uncharacterized protein n=1 Tax=Trichonephila clavipes TaxID=2585209 RepID=A0A8X7BE71_TRICX|nr:hypothetical protein TNCV_4149921 [Trichonephila clavipes]